MKKAILSSIILFFGLIFISTFSNAATTKTVNDETELRNAINEATENDVIELSTDIVLKAPIEITDKNITINGKGNAITREETNWSPNGNNGTLISVGSKAKVELKNVTLKNSQKYGVQSYNGGYVILNGVTITNCGYGAVLANAGTVEVKDLTLQKNGTPNNNGIEIAKGDATDEANIPEVIMNGTLSSTEKENVIYVAENNPNLKKFEVENKEGTIDKIFVNGNTVVITDDKNTVLYTSNQIKGDIDIDGNTFVENNNKTEENNKKDKTPKTGIESELVFAMSIMTLSMITLVVLRKKEIFD